MRASEDPALARLAAALSSAALVSLLAGTDLLRSPDVRAPLRMLHGLARVLRALGKATAVQFLDRPNQLGAWDLGVLPAALPGLRPVEDTAARATLEQAWGTAIPSEPGADLDQMLDLAAAGALRACSTSPAPTRSCLIRTGSALRGRSPPPTS